jgi:hypothetical protein
MAVRIIDNAHLNANQHSKWPPRYSETQDQREDGIWDTTNGLVDWTYMPDATGPAPGSPGARYLPRPRLPHVSFHNLRTLVSNVFGVQGDNPDAGEGAGPYSSLSGWMWDNGIDRYHHSDLYYYAYQPGVNFAARNWQPLTGIGAAPGVPAWQDGGNAYSAGVSLLSNRFDVADDMALRTFTAAVSMNRYANMYPSVFGFDNLGVNQRSWDITRNQWMTSNQPPGSPAFGNPDFHYEYNLMRCVSSVTRERTKKWLTDPANPNARVPMTPFDLRELFAGGGADYDAGGRPSTLLMEKLELLRRWMRQYRVLDRNGMGPRWPTPYVAGNPASTAALLTQPSEERRAQYLANLCEYVKAPPAPGVYVPTAYNFVGLSRPVYGLCRQPFLIAAMRDGGATQDVAAGATRNLSTVQVGFYLYNPYDTPINLTRYRLDVNSVFETGNPSGATRRGSSVSISLAPAGSIPPFGFLWISTDETRSSAATAPRSRVVMSVSAADATALRGAGPRIVAKLRCQATDDNWILMDVMDSRTRGANAPHTAGTPVNLGDYGVYAQANPTPVTGGLDFRDWDGSPQIRALANGNFVNSSGTTVRVIGYRSGVYRPMQEQAYVLQPDHWGCYSSASAVTTGLWLATGPKNSAAGPLFETGATPVWWGGGTPFLNSQPTLYTVYPFTTVPNPPSAPRTQPQDLWVGWVNGVGLATGDFGRLISGGRFLLPNRGVDPVYGTRFVNLGELALVATVGNGVAGPVANPDDPNSEYCFTQNTAVASEYTQSRPPAASFIDPVTRTYNDPQVDGYIGSTVHPANHGFPGIWMPANFNRWARINFDRHVKFDIYEGLSATAMGNTGIPYSDNARILDFVTLYMGNGVRSGSLSDFQPHTGPQSDTSLDFIPPDEGIRRRPAYREGRININTAPALVIRCLPFPVNTRRAHMAILPARAGQGASTRYYADGARQGNNVYISEALTGDCISLYATDNYPVGDGTVIPGRSPDRPINTLNFSNDPFDWSGEAPAPGNIGIGYLKTPYATAGGLRDPYFRDLSDIVLWSNFANPRIFARFYNQSGLGWDAMLNTRRLSSGTSVNTYAAVPAYGQPPKMVEYKGVPHTTAYMEPDNKRIPYPNGPTDFPEQGMAAHMDIRDGIWSNMTNVLSTRSDVFTAYIVIKLLRPTPGVVQYATTGQQFEDLGELRLVAILDRTNCEIITDPTSPMYGRADRNKPARVLAKLIQENR